MGNSAIEEVHGYQRALFDGVAEHKIDANHACSELVGVLVTMIAHIENPDERERHIDCCEMRVRELVYQTIREFPSFWS